MFWFVLGLLSRVIWILLFRIHVTTIVIISTEVRESFWFSPANTTKRSMDDAWGPTTDLSRNISSLLFERGGLSACSRIWCEKWKRTNSHRAICPINIMTIFFKPSLIYVRVWRDHSYHQHQKYWLQLDERHLLKQISSATYSRLWHSWNRFSGQTLPTAFEGESFLVRNIRLSLWLQQTPRKLLDVQDHFQ